MAAIFGPIIRRQSEEEKQLHYSGTEQAPELTDLDKASLPCARCAIPQQRLHLPQPQFTIHQTERL